MEESTYDLLKELLDDNYDKFDNRDTVNIGEKAKSCEKSMANKQSYQKKKDESGDKYELEEGEILESESNTTEISYMFQNDKKLLKSYHDIFNGNHLILKIYKNCEQCPYCILEKREIKGKN